MTQISVQTRPKLWPPLVTAATRPKWIVIRDVLLTVMAWGLLVWMLRDPLYVAYDYLRHPIFKLTTARPLDMKSFWLRLEIFFVISGALIVILFISGVIDRHRLRAAKHYPQPTPLTIAEQARHFKLEEPELNAAYLYRLVKVCFNEDGSISSLDAGEMINARTAIDRADEPAETI